MWVGQDGGVAEHVRRGWAQWHAQCSPSRVCPLPGEVAEETRTRFAGVIQRCMAGDESLIAEIQSSAESSAPIAELAGVSLDEPTEHQLTQ
jgi:hypothetical protein